MVGWDWPLPTYKCLVCASKTTKIHKIDVNVHKVIHIPHPAIWNLCAFSFQCSMKFVETKLDCRNEKQVSVVFLGGYLYDLAFLCDKHCRGRVVRGTISRICSWMSFHGFDAFSLHSPHQAVDLSLLRRGPKSVKWNIIWCKKLPRIFIWSKLSNQKKK